MRRVDESHVFTGMQRDLSVSKHPVQFLYDGRNIRLTAREDDSLLSITNERSTVEEQIIDGSTVEPIHIAGDHYLGHCLLNQYLVVFSTNTIYGQGNYDFIERIDLSTSPVSIVTLYSDSNHPLSFDPAYPIEAIPSYETEEIQKVYWTDGLNQPRVINIIGKIVNDVETFNYNFQSFDFVRELQLNETVTVEKLFGASGMFASGVIQYAFTYYTKYGQESNIFYTTPLYYISPKDRGAAPDEKVDNAFKITITGVDNNFDYLRIYSIQRTSINSTPICKRIQDIAIDELDYVPQTQLLQARYTDTGISGDSIDPMELLYKGGETIAAGTIEQKDGTMFLGDLEIGRNQLVKDLSKNTPTGGGATYYNTSSHCIANSYVTFDTNSYRDIYPVSESVGIYTYYNQLCAYNSGGASVPCCGFKKGNTYRCGVQFQYKTGKWSEPLFIADKEVTRRFSEYNSGDIAVPTIKCTLNKDITDFIKGKGYVKARALMVVPSYHDRGVICQGVLCPTLYTDNHRTWTDSNEVVKGNNDLYAQSSWFFRPYCGAGNIDANTGAASPVGDEALVYTQRNINQNTPDAGDAYNPQYIRQVEIEGSYKPENRFKIDVEFMTLHSPDVEFDEQFLSLSFENASLNKLGAVKFDKTRATLSIQTETPSISGGSGGALNISIDSNNGRGIISGLFYDDGTVEDSGNNPTVIQRLHDGNTVEPCNNKWLVYPWQADGSLNNDVVRGASQGVSSAVLKKKVVSNFRFCSSDLYDGYFDINLTGIPQVFSSNEVSILKVDNEIYEGNVDTMLYPDNWDGKYFAFESNDIMNSGINTPFNSTAWWKTFSISDSLAQEEGLYKWDNVTQKWNRTINQGKTIGNQILNLIMKKNPVRIKYKSTPHIVLNCEVSGVSQTQRLLPIIELTQPQSPSTIYGGQSMDALRENIWIPCGEPVKLGNETGGKTKFEYSWGDTYYQRWDCLKTYPFTNEDPNQIIEIGSFMFETYTNIAGRYDKNRGQLTNVSPINFNLLNPVYSQLNNFFSYKILPDDYYTNTQFPNQITWTKEKQSGADVDMWTNVTLASTYNMDGSKGKIEELLTWKDNIFCFQNKGISNILFNSRVQIPTSDGVPIEISNSYKVDGYRYISDGIGCDDKQLIMSTPQGVYFIDSVGSHLFHIGDGFTDISAKNNMTSIFKKEKGNWKKLLYDDINHDLYLIKEDESLCYSETLGQFTSWMDYADLKLIETYDGHVFTLKGISTTYGLWRMFEGEGYNNFFGTNYPWGFTFVSNGTNEGIVGLDKTFTNVEFRANVEGEGTTKTVDDTTVFDKPFTPFDFMETWNEYQHGIAQIAIRDGHNGMMHHLNNTDGAGASLKRKYRIWRCDIPRDNTPKTDAQSIDGNYTLDTELGIKRFSRRPLDRMRNPWLYLRVQKDAAIEYTTLPKTEVHDIVISYFV